MSRCPSCDSRHSRHPRHPRLPSWRRSRHGLHRHRVAALFVATGLVAAACASNDNSEDSDPVAPPSAPTVVASTSIWADITANVACDGLADVNSIVPLGADPHSYEVSLRDRETMENSVLIVTNGLGLEESLADTIGAVERGGTPVVAVAEHLDTLALGEQTAADADGGGSNEGDDPHVWFDPIRVAAALPVIGDALAGAGLDRDALESCIAAYEAELIDLDQQAEQLVDELAPDERALVTNHDALGYFAARYGFEILGSVIPSSSTLAETNPADMEELALLMEAADVNAIFAESQGSSADAEALARRVGGVEVITLLTGTLDQPGTEGATYIGWLLENARKIVDGLG